MNLTQIKHSNGIRNKIMGVAAGLNMLCMTSVLSFATVTNPWVGATGVVEGILGSLEIALQSIVGPIAIVAFIICFIMMLISQNQKKVEGYRSWCINIFVCIIAIYAAPFLIDLATSIGKSFKVSP